MRKMSDPIRREQAINYLRAGWPLERVLHSLDIKEKQWDREKIIDKDWAREVSDALAHKYDGVRDHAISMALRADDAGENKGSLEALKAILKLLDGQLDRESTRDNILTKAEVAPTRATGLIMTAEGARALAQELKQQKQLTEQEDDQ